MASSLCRDFDRETICFAPFVFSSDPVVAAVSDSKFAELLLEEETLCYDALLVALLFADTFLPAV